MSEQNKAVVRRFYEEVFDRGHVNAIDDLCTPNLIDHSPMPGQKPGVAGVKEMFAMYLKAFSGVKLHVEEIIAERDFVVARFSATATHTGEMMGAKPTGKKVTFHGIDMMRCQNGKVAEVWHQGDDMMVMTQLGMRPPL